MTNHLHTELAAAHEVQQARADALHAALEQAIEYVERIGGFMKPEDQHALRSWRALLAAGAR